MIEIKNKKQDREKLITGKAEVGMSFYVKSQIIQSNKDINIYITDPKSD